MKASYPAWQGRPGPAIRIAKAIALAVIVLLVLFPMWTVVATSLAEPADVVANGGWVVWPERITFGAYTEILDGGIVTRALLVSAGVTVLGTALSLTCTFLLAYALSLKEGRMTPHIDRRSLLKLAGAGALAPLLTACGDRRRGRCARRVH